MRMRMRRCCSVGIYYLLAARDHLWQLLSKVVCALESPNSTST
jgi:hypothetical protein